jgi:hypothetical protein
MSNLESLLYYNSVSSFEHNVTSMQNVYLAHETEDAFKLLVEKIEYVLKRDITENEIAKVKSFVTDYYSFIKYQFANVIEDIKQNEEKPNSETDCYHILYEYLNRAPSIWETVILWKNITSDDIDDVDSSYEAFQEELTERRLALEMGILDMDCDY